MDKVRLTMWKGLFVAFLLLCSGLAYGQQDYAKIKVDNLSDQQVEQLVKRAEAQGIKGQELYNSLRQRGMPSTEINKLRQRIERKQAQQTSAASASGAGRTAPPKDQHGQWDGEDDLFTIDTLDSLGGPKIFGADLFRNRNITFEPNLNMPTPANYIVGTGDQLNIDITGDSEASYNATVSPEGTIRVEYVGVIEVGGLSIEAVRSKLRNSFSSVYSGIRSGRTRLDVNLGNIRSIKITMTGAVTQAGTYTLPSVSTVFNALYAAGGPSDQGSFRNIQVIRNNQVISTIDTYDFLVNGMQTGNIRLEDQDVIHIPVYDSRIEMEGLVKRPGFYESIEGETFADLLRYAGGFDSKAYTARVKVLRSTGRDMGVFDIYEPHFSTYQPANGDQYIIEEVLDRFANRIVLDGAVFRPGDYELTAGLTVTELLQKSDGLREDAFMERAYIQRLNPDNTQRLISFDLSKLLEGEIEDIPLRREDRVVITSIFDLRDEYYVTVDGEVRLPGRLDFADHMTLGSAIQMAGGLSDAANIERIEVARRIRRNINQRDSVLSELVIVNFDTKEQALQSDFELQPFDIVSIRVSTGYLVQKQVRIEGEVRYPGVYTLTKQDERISDLIARAGGFTDMAYLKGASLRRTMSDAKISANNVAVVGGHSQNQEIEEEDEFLNESESMQEAALQNLEEKGAKTSLYFSDYVGIELERIMKRPKSKYDLLMEDGDVILVPRELQTVSVKGQVLNANRVRYQKGKPLSYYIDQAGGFTATANKKKVFVQYANGSVAGTKSGIGRIYPKVEPGAEIIVPAKQERQRTDPRTIIGLTSGVVSMAAIVVSLFRR